MPSLYFPLCLLPEFSTIVKVWAPRNKVSRTIVCGRVLCNKVSRQSADEPWFFKLCRATLQRNQANYDH